MYSHTPCIPTRHPTIATLKSPHVDKRGINQFDSHEFVSLAFLNNRPISLKTQYNLIKNPLIKSAGNTTHYFLQSVAK